MGAKLFNKYGVRLQTSFYLKDSNLHNSWLQIKGWKLLSYKRGCKDFWSRNSQLKVHKLKSGTEHAKFSVSSLGSQREASSQQLLLSNFSSPSEAQISSHLSFSPSYCLLNFPSPLSSATFRLPSSTPFWGNQTRPDGHSHSLSVPFLLFIC